MRWCKWGLSMVIRRWINRLLAATPYDYKILGHFDDHSPVFGRIIFDGCAVIDMRITSYSDNTIKNVYEFGHSYMHIDDEYGSVRLMITSNGHSLVLDLSDMLGASVIHIHDSSHELTDRGIRRTIQGSLVLIHGSTIDHQVGAGPSERRWIPSSAVQAGQLSR